MRMLKDLERQNSELLQKVAFFESWLSGETLQAAGNAAELQQLRADLDAEKEKATFLQKTLDMQSELMTKADEELKQLRALPAVVEAGALQRAARALREAQDECELLRLQVDRLDASITSGEGLTQSQKRRMWRYVSLDGVQPKPGERYMCLMVDLRDFCEKIASRRNSGFYNIILRTARIIGDYQWNRADIPDGHIVVAWQPELPHNEQRVIDTVIAAIQELRTEPRTFARLVCDTGRARMNKEAEKKYIADLLKRLDSAFNQRVKRLDTQAESLARKLMVV